MTIPLLLMTPFLWTLASPLTPGVVDSQANAINTEALATVQNSNGIEIIRIHKPHALPVQRASKLAAHSPEETTFDDDDAPGFTRTTGRHHSHRPHKRRHLTGGSFIPMAADSNRPNDFPFGNGNYTTDGMHLVNGFGESSDTNGRTFARDDRQARHHRADTDDESFNTRPPDRDHPGD